MSCTGVWTLCCVQECGHCVVYRSVDTVLCTGAWTLCCVQECGHCVVYRSVNTVLCTGVWTLCCVQECGHCTVFRSVDTVLCTGVWTLCCVQEMPLSEILAVDSANKMTGEAHHWFEIRTANVDFFVGDDSQVGAKILKESKRSSSYWVKQMRTNSNSCWPEGVAGLCVPPLWPLVGFSLEFSQEPVIIFTFSVTYYLFSLGWLLPLNCMFLQRHN